MRKLVWILIIIGITMIHAWELVFLCALNLIIPYGMLVFICWLFKIDLSDADISDNDDDHWGLGFLSGLITEQFLDHHN